MRESGAYDQHKNSGNGHQVKQNWLLGKKSLQNALHSGLTLPQLLLLLQVQPFLQPISQNQFEYLFGESHQQYLRLK